ncbi:MAG: HlyC/CorC family transporter [Candidatus Rokubacteria bacterium]|nr:HlyC/CorC family transporter [Candidatus Rokubacteria bacterium]
MTPFLVIVGLIVLNGLYVAAEFAIVGAPRTVVERRALAGDGRARRVLRILKDARGLDQYVATAQLGITAASIGLGMYGERVLAGWLEGWLGALGPAAAHGLASVIAIAVLTYAHIVLGEMVPKSLALHYPERTAVAVTPPMLWTRAVLYPLVVGLNGIGNALLRAVGIRRTSVGAEQMHTAAELRQIVEESEESGLLQRPLGKLLRELFEFGELTAGTVMVPRVRIVGLRRGATAPEVAAALRAARHTRYPVYEGDLDHIVGIVHVKDLLRQLLAGEPLTVQTVRPVPFVPESSTLDTVLDLMLREGSEMVIVLDEHGGTAGLLAAEDLSEEIIGEIDEGRPAAPAVGTGADGRVHAAGTARLDEIGERFGVALSHPDVDSVSGLVLALLERPPRLGDAVVFGGLRFEVTVLAGRGVRECAITRAAGGADGG